MKSRLSFWLVVAAILVVLLVAVNRADRRKAWLERKAADDRMNAEGRYLNAPAE